MKTMTETQFAKLLREGRIEAVSDRTRSGFQEIRWLSTGQRETVQIKP